ncbi:hypothetical protein DFH27DRAFT_479474 [Peziza echinospora]|nr:hypothetical protein DFH27DRAFT_479474 [Peziza echinospora]
MTAQQSEPHQPPPPAPTPTTSASTTTTSTTAFQEIPILNLSLSRSPATKPQFLADLRHALLDVGFLYISHTGISDDLIQKVISYTHTFFSTLDSNPQERARLEMINSPHFLGYSRLGNETTRYKTDWREQIDLATELPAPADDEPVYRRLRGPNQWPGEDVLPGFRETITHYMDLMTELSTEFVGLTAEAIGLPANAFDRFYWGEGDGDEKNQKRRQDKLKLVKYPDAGTLQSSTTSNQGVGPHKDSMLSSYLLQASPHRGLQAQNSQGEWIDCPPIPGTFVVAIGQGLEAVTGGVCVATTHRVLSPGPGEGARYSVPFFQGVSYDAAFEEMYVPEEVRQLKRERLPTREEVEMTFQKGRFQRLGEATMMNRVKSHQDVAERWYPELLKIVREHTARELRQEEERQAKEK